MKPPVIIGIVVIVLILGAGAWYAYTNPTIATELGFRHAMPGTPGMNMGTTTPYAHGGMRGGFTSGTIEVLTDTGFTLTLANGDTKNINLLATTTIQNYTSASSTPTTITADQLSVGEQVSVIGSLNPDGSIDARFVRTGAVPTFNAGDRPHGAGTGHMQPQQAQ